MMAPLVSIITPTYNHEYYIGECIESVLNQTFEDWEMLIMDDGSTDGTPDVVASYDDDRIRYFPQEHVGIWRLSETYNKGLKLARGKYIAILEGDDYWPPYTLEKQVQALENKNVILSFGKKIYVNDKGEKLGPVFRRNVDFTKDIYQNKPRGSILKEILLHGYLISSQTVLCRKDSLMQIGGFKQPLGLPFVDLPTWLEFCLIGEFSATNEVLGYWRRHGTQVTQTYLEDIRVGKRRAQFLEDFYDRIPLEIKNRFGINKRILHRHLQKQRGWTNLALGRINLLNQNWSRSRRNFITAIKKAPFRAKPLALLGLGFSFIRKDLEPIYKILGLPRVR